MKTHAFRSPAWYLPFLLLGFLFLAACDSEEDDAEVQDGTYNFATLSYTSDTPALGTVNILQRLDPAQTELEVFGGNETFTLNYALQGESRRSLGGAVRASGSDRLRFEFDSSDDDDRERILMPRSFTLNIDGTALVNTSIDVSDVDLEAFDSDLYTNIDDDQGTLSIRLTPQ